MKDSGTKMDIPELLYLIVSKCDGFERENMRLVCKMFNEFKFNIKTDNPFRDREVSYINQDTLEYMFIYGHIDILRIYIRNHPEHRALCFDLICMYGTIELLELVEAYVVDWQNGIHNACTHGRLEIVRYILVKGYVSHCCLCMLAAIYSGNLDLIKFLYYLNKMYIDGKSDINFTISCRRGHANVVRWLIRKGYNQLTEGFFYAVTEGHIETILLLIEHGANYWDTGLIIAAKHGYIDIVKLMIEKGAVHIDEAVRMACGKGQIGILDYFIETIGFDANKCLIYAAKYGNIIALDHMLERGANSFDIAIQKAMKNGHDIIVLRLRSYRGY